MGRKNEVMLTLGGMVAGAAVGAIKGASIGIATGGTAMAATIPLGIIGGALAELAGNKIGSEIDRQKS